MKTRAITRGGVTPWTLALVVVATLSSGCESMRTLVAIPFDMAANAAIAAAKVPYETAKIGAQGLVDVVAAMAR